ncbi:MAG: hypothetical protein K0V04_20615, partial [Deltaproteobacteria bacterium]|nr:hypothetical protein [Deltaproteobacteria bacterium]
KTDTPQTAVPEGETRCSPTYSALAAVDDGVLSISINGETFTDADPFVCTLASNEQVVVFDFNDESVDPGDACSYALVYESGGTTFDTQRLSCLLPELEFSIVATPDATDPDCDGKPRLHEDPKIVLKTQTCGGAVE